MINCLDASNLFFITYGAFTSNLKKEKGDDYVIQEEDLGLFWHMFLRKIMPYLTNYRENIFCFEGLHSTQWRKEIYPPYKENRVDRKNDPNYKYVGMLMEKCIEFTKLFHTKVLAVPFCEGDDEIYATCKYYTEKGEQVKIVSTDKDLSQIMNYFDTVTQFNPIKETSVEKNENILLEKGVVGDVSDNIKPFKGIGPKTFEKMLNDKTLWNKKMPPKNMEILETVLKIVDLRKYPEEYQNNIKTELDKEWNTFNKDAVEKFMLDNKLNQCYYNWTSDWCPCIEATMSDSYEKPDAIEEIMDIING